MQLLGLIGVLSIILFIWVIFSFKKTILYRDILDNIFLPSYKKTPYLTRYTLLSCKWFTIKIHKALISDPDEPHDHPWNYLSIILWGGYWEETILSPNPKSLYEKLFEYIPPTIKWYRPLSILYRKGDKLHKLIIPKGKYCLSLIITFKKWRKWGYLNYKRDWEEYKYQ